MYAIRSYYVLVGADANVSDMLGQFIDSLALGDVFLYVFLFLLSASLITAPAATALESEHTGPRKAFYITQRPIPAISTGIALSMMAVVYVLFRITSYNVCYTKLLRTCHLGSLDCICHS